MPKQTVWPGVKRVICKACERSLRKEYGGTALYVPKADGPDTPSAARDKAILVHLQRGMRVADVARKFHLTTARISQIRAAFRHRRPTQAEAVTSGEPSI